MNMNLALIRVFFGVLSVLFSTLFFLQVFSNENFWTAVAMGGSVGLIMLGALVVLEMVTKTLNIKSLNTLSLGLLFGFLCGFALSTVIDGFFALNTQVVSAETAGFVKTVCYLLGIYLGMSGTFQAAEELQISIPFIKFKPTVTKKKDILMDFSILQDMRIIDLASSGVLDSQLILPRFVLKQLYHDLESGEETDRIKARRALDVIKRLESLESLNIRYTETDFPDVKDVITKLIRLARLMDANMITSDITQIQQSNIESTEGIKMINLRSLANSLKPLTQSGETIQIKIQRYGKESRQGVGYLEDGTMVVVNGGAEYLGETISAHVLSVKHTSSGRMIFCNAVEERQDDDDLLYEDDDRELAHAGHDSYNSHGYD